ncbi:MAG: glycosyltransferase family 8 protein [Patescibacteria group bacterium]
MKKIQSYNLPSKEGGIYIYCATDANYAAVTGVMLTSLCMTAKDPKKLKIFIADGGISQEDISKYEGLETKFGAEVYLIEISKDIYSSLITNLYMTEATYYRFAVEHIFPTLDKVIYLDCDVVLMSDIAQLWNVDIGNNYFAAVRDHLGGQEFFDKVRPLWYSNAGVLLINLPRWRREGFLKKALEYIEREKPFLMDQDALNEVSQGLITRLHPKFNCAEGVSVHKTPFQDQREREETLANPVIYHFLGSKKPWTDDPATALAYKVFRRYADDSAWKNSFGKPVGWKKRIKSIRLAIRARKKNIIERVVPLPMRLRYEKLKYTIKYKVLKAHAKQK